MVADPAPRGLKINLNASKPSDDHPPNHKGGGVKTFDKWSFMQLLMNRENIQSDCFLKENMNASKSSEHPPDREGGISTRLGGNIDCKDKTSAWHLIGFPDGILKKNLNAPRPSEHPPVRGKKCQNV